MDKYRWMGGQRDNVIGVKVIPAVQTTIWSLYSILSVTINLLCDYLTLSFLENLNYFIDQFTLYNKYPKLIHNKGFRYLYT